MSTATPTHERSTWTTIPERAAQPVTPEWMDDAACKGRTNLFFGLAGERPERRVRREESARRLCANCPVLLPCRNLARLGRENGFWGGESEEERAAAGYPPRSISRRAVQQAGREGTDPTVAVS